MRGVGKAVVAAFLGNLAIAAAKFVGAAMSGSSALLAEAIHSVVDTFNQVFLFLGLRLQRRPVTEKHPLGFGRERFFWSLIAAVFIFFGGAIFNIYEGVDKWLDPEPITNLTWALGVLGFAFVAEAASLWFSFKEARRKARSERVSVWKLVRFTTDSTLLTVIIEDTGALIGILIATTGVLTSYYSGEPHFDAAASIAIGLLLAVMAFVLGGRSHSLLIGQSANTRDLDVIADTLQASDLVREVRDTLTVQIAPDELVLAARLVLEPQASGPGVGVRLDALENRLHERVPELKHIYLQVEPRDAAAREDPSG